MQYGLIGEHLPHSFSKDIHERLGEYEYELHEIVPGDLQAFMEARDFCGINVTIPYKQAVIPYLDSIDEGAQAIGAVNTIVNRKGRLEGFNTDFAGMRALIQHMGLQLAGKTVLILGSGGTSKTAFAVAQSLGAAQVLRVSRSGRDGAITYEEAVSEHLDAAVIINTTPCGMFPNNGQAALDVTAFSQLEGVVDAVYNPLRTQLVLQAGEQGVRAEGGLYMLVGQAIFAAEHFLDRKLDVPGLTQRIYNDLRAEKENIVLIGMPGCGKTTVGKVLAQKLGRPFVDTDEVVAATAGMLAGQIIETQGEAAFRELEAQVVASVGKEGGKVIATGGGVILKQENLRALRQNGRLFFLDRALKDITPTPDRPLSQSVEALAQLYDQRHDCYWEAADLVIPVDGSVEEVAADVETRFFQ